MQVNKTLNLSTKCTFLAVFSYASW